MGETTVTLERAEAETIDQVEALLTANELPTEDLGTAPARFYLAHAEGSVIGCGGIGPYGSDGLLRSVVVAQPYRGRGYGTALCEAPESRLRSTGVRRVYLLTETARDFFHRRGYEGIERDHVPSSIRQTAEFAELCPKSAACLYKVL